MLDVDNHTLPKIGARYRDDHGQYHCVRGIVDGKVVSRYWNREWREWLYEIEPAHAWNLYASKSKLRTRTAEQGSRVR